MCDAGFLAGDRVAARATARRVMAATCHVVMVAPIDAKLLTVLRLQD
jgi:hypothetical protein